MSTWILIIACAAVVNVMCALAFGGAENAFRDWGARSARQPSRRLRQHRSTGS